MDENKIQNHSYFSKKISELNFQMSLELRVSSQSDHQTAKLLAFN